MEIRKRDRAELKSYFVKNAIPTQNHFAELIDAMLNQKDDGIVKLPEDPLSIQAAGNDTSKKVINFYQNFTDANPSWILSLKPGGKAGLHISDGNGKSRLFIDQNTGNIGIGKINPSVELDVDGALKVKSSITFHNVDLPSDIWSFHVHNGLGFWGTQGSYRSSWVWNYYRKKDEGNLRNRINVLKVNDFNNVAGVELGNDGILFRAQENVSDGSTHPTLRMIVKPDGKVGIGKPNPGRTLDVNGTIAITGIGDRYTTSKWQRPIELEHGSAIVWKKGGGDYSFGIGKSSKPSRLYFTRSSADNDSAAANYDMVIDNSGNVGIGMYNPGFKLDVTGNVRINLPSTGTNPDFRINNKSGQLAFFVRNDGHVGIGTLDPSAKLEVNGFTQSLGVSVNNGQNTGVGRGLWLWSPTDSNHVIYSANPNGKSPANKKPAQGFFNAGHRLRLRTARGQGFLFENNEETALMDIDATDGKLWTHGAMYCGNSDIYFTKTDHNHTGIGNTSGYAAIENAANYNTLMILGRTVNTNPLRRSVSIWDELNVHGPLITKRSHIIKIGVPSAGHYGNDGIRGEPNLWLDAQNRVIIKAGFQSRGMDIAERFEADGKFEPGDVVVFDEKNKIAKRCELEGDSRVIGVVSGDPAFILGLNEKQIPVALCGRVPCKVDAKMGSINAGDLLTTSTTRGHAQKVVDQKQASGAIIGKALESMKTGKGKITMMVVMQ